MGAPLGFKTFATGDVLTAADTNGYLMQGVWTFASAAARSAAVTSPQEGNMSYLKDTNSTEYYDGAAWVALGSSGGWTLTSTTTLSTGSTSLTIPSGYKQVKIYVQNYQSSGSYPGVRLNSVTTSTYRTLRNYVYGTSTNGAAGGTDTYFSLAGGAILSGNQKNSLVITLEDYENTVSYKMLTMIGIEQDVTGYDNFLYSNTCAWLSTSAITTLQMYANAGTWAGGVAYVYGVK